MPVPSSPHRSAASLCAPGSRSGPGSAPRRVVLLDRDGTINEDVHYLRHPDDLRLLPGAVEGLRRLAGLGFDLVVVTNQSGLARGYFSPADLEAIHARLCDLLTAEGVALAGIYVCPHGPDDGCSCRKPRPGLALAARADLGFDPGRAYVIGDKRADLHLARAIGATSILVRTGYGAEVERAGGHGAVYVADDLAAAAAYIARTEALAG